MIKLTEGDIVVLPQSAYWAPDLLMGDIPSKESNHAWEALMPGTHLKSPVLSPQAENYMYSGKRIR